MAQHDGSPEALLVSMVASAAVGVVWGGLGYYRARGKGEAFDWNKFGETVVIAALAGAGYFLVHGAVPTQEDLLLFAPGVVGVTAGAEKVTRTARAKAKGEYLTGANPRLLLFDGDLYREGAGTDDERVGVTGHVRNNTPRRIPDLAVTATFYDDERDSRGRFTRRYTDLAPYEYWEFDVEYDGNQPAEVVGYRLDTKVTKPADAAAVQNPDRSPVTLDRRDSP